MSDGPVIYTLLVVIIAISMGVVSVALFYVEIAARRVVKRIATGEFESEILAAEARTANRGGFRSRLRWLESRQAGLPEAVRNKTIGVLSVQLWCRAAMAIMFALWILALLIDWLHPSAA